MSLSKPLVLSLVVILALIVSNSRAEFPLKDGDVWVMAGDSITAQHLHSNYFEAFCYARYPKLKFGFRNSGVSGHTLPSTLARFDYDIAAWKPTIVSVELGMNDKGGTKPAVYIANMDTMVKRIRAVGARPVIFAASPINDGKTMAALDKIPGGGGNAVLNHYATDLKGFCAKHEIPYADQFHALIDVWGKNLSNESLAKALDQVKKLAGDDKLEGVEHLRAFLSVHDKKGSKPVSMQGDPVHPGPNGQLMMAAALLKGLGAEPFVSSATIDVAAKNVDAKDCVIEALVVGDGKIAFDRLDERLPFPIPEEARAVVAFDPTILELSQYLLKVKGLKAGKYELTVDGGSLGTLTSDELSAGINLTAFGLGNPKSPNPTAAQSKAILDAVSARAKVVSQWRGMSKNATAKDAPADLRAKLDEVTKQVNAGDERIREAARPKKMHFELIAK